MNRYAVLFSLLLVVSCAGQENVPPYLVPGLEAFNVGKTDAYRFAGIEFDFCNTAATSVESFTVRCRIYAAEDHTNPLAGTNDVTARFDGIVRPGEQKHLCVSLDSRIAFVPQIPFLVDFFTVPEIVYSDGSVWKDPLCVFYCRSYP